MKKLYLLGLFVAAGAFAAPAQAQEARRADTDRRASAPSAEYVQARMLFPWFYRGHDEEAQPRRRIRRVSLQAG